MYRFTYTHAGQQRRYPELEGKTAHIRVAGIDTFEVNKPTDNPSVPSPAPLTLWHVDTLRLSPGLSRIYFT